MRLDSFSLLGINFYPVMKAIYSWIQAFLDLPTFLQLSFIFVIGALVGSFLNVVIYRLPMMLEKDWQTQARELLDIPQPNNDQPFTLSTPRSHCPQCKKTLKIWHNLPIISYLLLRGKCRYCHHHIPISYPIIECFSGAIAVLIFLCFGMNLQALATTGFAFALIALAAIDYRHQILPDSITLPLLWAGIILSLWGVNQFFLETAVIGAILGYLCLWVIIVGFRWLYKKDGMGLGDAKLLAAMMTWIPFQYLPYLLLLACSSGLIITVILRIKNRQSLRNNPVAFGPYLAFSGLTIKLITSLI